MFVCGKAKAIPRITNHRSYEEGNIQGKDKITNQIIYPACSAEYKKSLDETVNNIENKNLHYFFVYCLFSK